MKQPTRIRPWSFALFAVAALALALVFFLGNPRPQRVSLAEALSELQEEHEPEMDAAGEEEDDWRGRAEFDWYRLRDPQTGQIPRGIRTRELAYAQTLPNRERSLKQGRRQIATQEWSARGPFNVGGRTRALAVDIANHERVLAGGVSGGMWISEDAGATWSMTTEIAEIPSVTCLAQDAREGHTDTWYYGTGEYRGSAARSINSRVPQYTGNGIFKSTDGGLSWTLLPSTTSPVNEFDSAFDVVFDLAVNPANTDQDEVWAACYASIYHSLDGGDTWDLVLGDPNSGQLAWTDVEVGSDGTVWATLASGNPDGGVWRKLPGSDTFEEMTPADFPDNYNRVVIGIAPANEEIVYFLGETPGAGYDGTGGWHSLWKYDGSSGVAVWTNLSPNLPNLSSEVQLPFGYDYASQGGYNMVVATYPTDPDIVYIGGTSLFRSTDGFSTTENTEWIGGYNYYYGVLDPPEGSDISYPQHHADVHNLAFDPTDPDVLYCSHDGGLSKTTDALAVPGPTTPFPWDYIEGYVTTQFYWVAVDPITPEDPKIIGGMQDNGSWITGGPNFGDDWIKMYGGDGMACDAGAAEQADWRSWYVTTQYGGTFLRIVLDSENNFVDYHWFQPTGADFERWITPFRLSPTNHVSMVMADVNSVFYTSGLADVTPLQRVSGSTLPNQWVTAVAMGPEPDNRLYYGSMNPDNPDQPPHLYRIDNVDSGTPTITDISAPDFPPGGWLHNIAVDRDNADIVIAVFTNYNVRSLFYTTDGGTTWRNVGGNLEENPDGTGNGPSTFWVEIAHVDGAPLYLVGTTVGLFSTTDLDADPVVWEQEGASEIGNVWVTSMDLRPLDNFLAVGTHGRGTFSATLAPASGVDASAPAIPEDFALLPAYPNPFNAATTVRVRLPRTAPLTVDVFNLQGQRVTRLASGSFGPGEHRFSLDGRQLASGTYVVRAQARGLGTSDQKVVLVK